MALLVFISLGSSALASGLERSTMRFDRLSVTEGLSQNTVTAIEQDKTGFLWFATESGLDRYDGFTFKNYRTERGNPKSLASEFVRDLDMDDDGRLWIATDGGGVSYWNPETDDFTTYRHDPNDSASPSSDRIRTILTDARGIVWVGSRDSGLSRLNPATGEFSHFRHVRDDPKTLSSDEIHALALDTDGTLWIGTGAGLDRLDAATGEIRRHPANPEESAGRRSDPVTSLLIDHEGTLWVGTARGGLRRFDARTQGFNRFVHDNGDPHSLSSNSISAIFEDDRDRLWIGTDKGLNLMIDESGKFSTYRSDPTDVTSLSNDFVFSIFQDHGGVLWVGTNTGGLNKWNPRSWSFGHVRPPVGAEGNAFSSLNATSFAEDPAGKLWIGTFGGGINVIDRADGSVRQLRHDSSDPAGLSDDRVMALLADSNGRIWAGTMTGGLNVIEPETGSVRTYRHDPSDPNSIGADGVMALAEGSQRKIWIGTFGGGVSRMDATGVFTNFEHDPADHSTLSSNRATSIVEDASGVIWVGTDGGGLNRLDRASGEWRHLRHDPDDPTSLSADTVYALHVDARGDLWIGTRAGLDRLISSATAPENLRLQNVSARDGVAGNSVYGIKSDAAGNLWLSTNHGLTRYIPASGETRVFHESQGLQGEEFNFGASYASGNGTLYFGGSNGFNAFDPMKLEFNSLPPRVALTSLSILNRPVSTDRPVELITNLHLGYSDDVITFGLSALDFAAPQENRYAYKLEGFDDDWVETGRERRFTYTNLDGGSYVLRVKAANSDGVWGEDSLAMTLSVANPPWQTWWAYTVYVLAVLVAAYSFWRRQQEKLKREAEYSRRLEQEVRDRTRELKDKNADLNEANSKLLQASTTDALTGLKNRRYLFDQITKDVDLVLRHYRDGTETLKPGGNNDLVFMMVDLDHFKPVNDSCGHEAGDEMLLQIRDVLLKACRLSDDVIRWGGDEFLVVARETNRKCAATLAERIRADISERVYSIGNGQVARTTASIGYASYPFIVEQPGLLTWEEVLGVADAAMYEAKQKRNAWLGIDGIQWSTSGTALYQAIKTDPGQLARDGIIQAIESVEAAAEAYG